MNLNSFSKVFLLSISLILTVNSVSAASIMVYAPKTQNLNVIDTIGLHTYCTLSKLFGGERSKCFASVSLVKESTDETEQTTSTTTIQNFQISLDSINSALAKDRSDIELLLSRSSSTQNMSGKSSSNVVTERTQTIVKYIVGDTTPGPRGADGTPGKTIVSSYQNPSGGLTFVYNDNTTFSTPALVGLASSTSPIYYSSTSTVISSSVIGNNSTSSAFGSIVVGNNIFNNVAGSVQIGNSNNTKLFIGADGFVAIGGTSTSSGSLIGLTDDNGQPVVGEEKLRVSGHIVARGFVANAGADLAELFPSDDIALNAGTIVMFSNIEHKWNISGNTNTSDDYNVLGVVKANDVEKVIGVIATNPGLTLGGDTKNGVPVAFAGRIPVKITSENGKIEKGDHITLSSTHPGFGAKLLGNGFSFGVALSDDTGIGTVLMLVKNEKIENK